MSGLNKSTFVRRCLLGQSRSKRACFLYHQTREKGFFSNFMENIKKESSKDQDFKEALHVVEQKLTDVKKSRVFESIKSTCESAKNEIISKNKTLIEDLKTNAKQIQENTAAVSTKISEGAAFITSPVRKIGRKMNFNLEKKLNNPLLKTLSSNIKRIESTIVDESEAFKYGGYMDKSERIKRKQAAQQKSNNSGGAALDAFSGQQTQENPEAGTNLVVHPESSFKVTWNNFKDNNPIFKNLFEIKRQYDESNNVFIYFTRSFTYGIIDSFRSFFRENETGQAIKEITLLDPSFKLETFFKNCREYIIPEILEAFLKADLQTIYTWSSESVYNLCKFNFQASKKPGLSFDGRILDLRSIDLCTAKIVGDNPVLVISFQTQQVSYLKNSSGQIVQGKEDDIENMFYVWALAKYPEFNPITGGWKLIEMAARKN